MRWQLHGLRGTNDGLVQDDIRIADLTDVLQHGLASATNVSADGSQAIAQVSQAIHSHGRFVGRLPDGLHHLIAVHGPIQVWPPVANPQLIEIVLSLFWRKGSHWGRLGGHRPSRCDACAALLDYRHGISFYAF